MLRFLAFAYGLLAYAAGMGSLALFGAFLLGFDVFARGGSSAAAALAVDVGLIVVFGLQHSVMARPGFKGAWQRVVPAAVERSTFVAASGIALGALLWLWRPLDGELWRASGAGLAAVYAAFALGALVLVAATFMIDHFELFGLKQAWRAPAASGTGPARLRVVLLYRLVRHPMMLGLLIMLWAAPRMTFDHFILSLGLTAYILIALCFEERDLAVELGPDYRRYQRTVPMLLPVPRMGAGEELEPRASQPGA